jgi:hypothetical protein
MYRGYKIDAIVRDMVSADSELCGRLIGCINKGVDFTDTRTGIRYEMTTQGALAAHQRNYGPDIGLIGAIQILGPLGFWNCSFKGTLNDIIFRGKYLLAYQYELSGEPKRTGLHMVDFSDSELHWVAAYNCCTLEKVNLPGDGSAFICNTHDLIQLNLILSEDISK